MECVEGPSRKWAARSSSGTQLRSPWSEVSSAGDDQQACTPCRVPFQAQLRVPIFRLDDRPKCRQHPSAIEAPLGTGSEHGSFPHRPNLARNGLSSLLFPGQPVIGWVLGLARVLGPVDDKAPGSPLVLLGHRRPPSTMQVRSSAVPFTAGSSRPCPLCFSPMFVIGWCPGQPRVFGPVEHDKTPGNAMSGRPPGGLGNATEEKR